MLLSNSVFRCEVEGDTHSIRFTYTKHFTLSADELWQGLQQAMTDTANAWLWPSEFSIHQQEQLPIEEGAYFHTTYKMQHPDTGERSEYRYRYRMVRWRPDEYLFEYQAQKGHPFRGGGVASLHKAEDGGTLFSWDGLYTYTADRSGAEEIFSWYFPTFFRRLEKKINDYIAAKDEK